MEIFGSRRADRHGSTFPPFYSVLCIMTPNRDLRVLAFAFFSVASASKSLVIYKPLVVVNQKPLLLAPVDAGGNYGKSAACASKGSCPI